MPEVPETIARLGAIGDVHCEDRLLEVALTFLKGQRLDRVVCVGDIVDGPGDADRCVSLLEEHGVLTVAGNHERWFFQGGRPAVVTEVTEAVSPHTRAYLEALPKTLRLATAAGTLLLCHGVGEDDMSMLKSDTRGYALQDIPALRELMLDPTVDFMLGGHTHEKMVRVFTGLRVINCGTLRRKDGPGVVILDFVRGEIGFYDITEEGAHLASTILVPDAIPLPPALHP